MDKLLEVKWKDLQSILARYSRPLLALSGGLDSSFLSFAIAESSIKGTTITIASELFSITETKRSQELSDKYGLTHIEIDFSGKHSVQFKENPVDRCYICKKALFTKIRDYAEAEGFDVLFDGTTYDDLTKHRPGLKAKDELGIVSPIAEARITKDELRKIARHFGLEFAELPSFSCLATRFPYGEELTLEKLSMVEKAERFFISKDFKQIRVRSHKGIARIEIFPKDFYRIIEDKREVISYLKDLGFNYITLDLEGFRSGSMDI